MNRLDPDIGVLVQLIERAAPDPFVHWTQVKHPIGLSIADRNRLIHMTNDLAKDLLCAVGAWSRCWISYVRRGALAVVHVRTGMLFRYFFELNDREYHRH